MVKTRGERISGEESGKQEELSHILNDLFQEYRPSFEQYQWPLESTRWNELVFCILESCSSRAVAESAGKAMLNLDLLKVEKLAELASPSKKRILSARAKLVLGILQEAGFEESGAERALETIVEAARTIKTNYHGKVQQMLRREGELMVNKLVGILNFGAMDDKLARLTVAKWLQNVLNLPIYLENKSSDAFCLSMNVKPTELVTVADGLDINVAILDDLIKKWYDAEMAAQSLAKHGNAGLQERAAPNESNVTRGG